MLILVRKTYKSLQLIYQFVREKLNFDENSIIVYGFSLGTGVAFDLACNKEYKFAGLILQAPFLSIFRTLYNTKRQNILIILIIVTKLNF